MSVDKRTVLVAERNIPEDGRISFNDLVEKINEDLASEQDRVNRLNLVAALQVLEEHGDVEERNGFYRRRTTDPIAEGLTR